VLHLKTLKENKGVEYDIFKLDKSEDHFKKCYINCFLTYLGEYRLPPDARRPPYFKRMVLYYYTGKHEWAIFDSIEEREVYDGKKPKLYKKVTPEIASYPGYGLEDLSEMLRRFNVNFTLSDFNDEYAEYLIEKRYQKEPNLRPSKEKYDDVKKPFPTVRWREFEDVDDDYLKFCDAVECALEEFITSIDANRKAVSKPLCALLTKLNKISVVHPIDSLEQEELYDYIVKILQTLRKAQLIDRIDNIREW
jgi:hypothetical protein